MAAVPPDPRVVVLLGIPFHDVTMAETLECIDALIARGRPGYLATANLDFAMQASRDVELQRILLEAELVLCDGTPLIWASRWLGAPLRERVAGSDLMPFLFAHAAKRGHRLFFLGSTDEVLETAAQKCLQAYPGLIIAGRYAPPFARLLEMEQGEITRRVREAKPDILLVAMGCPKQEKWIYMNYRDLGVPVSLGIGASLDFVAGKFKRAPVWMRVCGLEWVFRLMQEPRRLFTRYWLDLVFFVKTLRQERALWKQSANGLAESRVIESPEKEFSLHAWSGRIDAAALAEGIIVAPRPINARPNVVLDMSGVTFIDSTGLGLLVKIFKSCRDAGGALVLLKPSETMARILAAVRLDRMIPAAADLSDVTRLLPKPEQTAVQVFYDSEEARLVAVATVDLTAATATDFSTALRDHWQDSTTALTLDLDLRRVTFLDSSGLGALVKAAKLVRERNGAQFRLVNVPPNAANVIKLANLQSFLGVA